MREWSASLGTNVGEAEVPVCKRRCFVHRAARWDNIGVASVFRLSYPVTSEVHAALSRYPAIARGVQIPTKGGSELEIVRFLRKDDRPRVARLLTFIDRWLPEAGADLVKQVDPLPFRRLLAELFLFAHLRAHVGAAVQRPVRPRGGQRGHDVEARWDGKVVKLEVYTPSDFVGLAHVQEHVTGLVEYIDVPRGFVAEVDLESLDDSVESVWYAYELPGEARIAAWFHDLRDRLRLWLLRTDLAAGDEFVCPGPIPTTQVRMHFRVLRENSDDRDVIVSLPTRSSDIKLLFQCGTPEDMAKLTWAKKLGGKMRHAQAGPPADGAVRLLVVNFAESDAGWPSFFAESSIAENFAGIVRLVSGAVTPMAFEAVVPAWLEMDSFFGVPVYLDPSRKADVDSFVMAAALDMRHAPRTSLREQQAEVARLTNG